MNPSRHLLPIDGRADAGFALVLQPRLPAAAPGQWMQLSVRTQATQEWWVKLELTDQARGQVVREAFLGPSTRHGAISERSILVHVPFHAGALRLHVYGHPVVVSVHARVLGRVGATLALLHLSAGHLSAGHLSAGYLGVRGLGAGGLPAMLGRLRASLGNAPSRIGEAPPYAVWTRLFEPAPVAFQPVRDMQVVVVGQHGPPCTQTIASAGAMPVLVVRDPADWAQAQAGWLLIIGAGERLAPRAVARFAAARSPGVDGIYGDVDVMDAAGARRDPLFKPGPDRVLLRSGLLTRGACLFRRPSQMAALPADADAARLELALAATTLARIPAVLTHLPALPPAATSSAAMSSAARARPPDPGPDQDTPLVSILVASACRSPHVLRCLRRVVGCTAYAQVEIIVAASSLSPRDHRQARIVAQLQRLPRTQVLDLDMPQFNYAAVNNRAAASASGALLLFLNDDVAPIQPGWLHGMVAYLRDPGTAAVGARLLYGNDTIQHGGVVMGAANLCEHADRFRRADDAGPYGMSALDREVSAVTAACMLVRADAFREVGGMDEAFAIALNDVDLCMRLREARWRIVYAAGISLYHYESLSLGRHYAGDRAGLEATEVRRLRARWESVIADDPFYNPNASLETGRLWQPAFPPRGAGFDDRGGKVSAPH